MQKFFIAGCQRSGTTLMRLILDSHPEICCLGEAEAYDYSDGKIAVSTSKSIIGMQTPIWSELFFEYDSIQRKLEFSNENPKGLPIIFMVRDVRDVIVSMKSLKNWIDKEVIEKISVWVKDKNRRIGKQEANLLFVKENPFWQSIWAAIYWKYKNEAYSDMKSYGYNILGVNYDTLVTNPIQELSTVVKFLKVPWHDNLLSHHSFSHSGVNAKTGMTMGKTKATLPIHTESIKKYMDSMPINELDAIAPYCLDFNQNLKQSLTRNYFELYI